MSPSEYERIREQYHRAQGVCRDHSNAVEVRARAIADVAELGRKLDQHDAELRRRPGLSTDAAEAIAAGAEETRADSPAGGPNATELRAFMTPGNPSRDLWVKPPREQVMGPLSAFTQQRHSFITSDTATIGSAYYFTPELYKSVVMGMLAASGILEADPTLILTNHLRTIQVPCMTADATASAGVEGSAATEAHPTGDHLDLGAFRFDGVFNVSLEMIMSAEYDLEDLLVTFATRAIANKVAALLALGAGTTEPLGLFTAAAVGVGATTALATAVTMDEVLALTKSVGKGYRKAAKLVVSDACHTSLLSLKDGQGDFLLRSLDGGGEQFAGKPLFTEPQADQTSMSASEVHGVYGDFSGYFVRMTPMFFRRSDADPLNPAFSFAIWLDANVADAGSLRSLVMHS